MPSVIILFLFSRAALLPSGPLLPRPQLTILLILPSNSVLSAPGGADLDSLSATLTNLFPMHTFNIQSVLSWASPYRHHLPDPSQLNLALIRNGSFLDFFPGEWTVERIAHFIESAELSWVDSVNDSRLCFLVAKSARFFLLSGPELLNVYEDMAFCFRLKKTRFFYHNSVRDAVNLFFFDEKHGITRWFDGDMTLEQFILSCAVPKRTPVPPPPRFLPMRLLALLDQQNESSVRIARDSLAYIERQYGRQFQPTIVDWSDATPYLPVCHISESDLSFVLFLDIPDGRKYCWLFPDMDLFTAEGLGGFVQSAIHGDFLDDYFIDEDGYSEVNVPTTFARIIPGPLLSVLLLTNRNSSSNDFAQGVLDRIKTYFPREKITFYTCETRRPASYVPSSDGFPLFVAWRPRDRQPHVFRGLLSVQALARWLGTFIKRDPENESGSEKSGEHKRADFIT
jgi:hypothetical protein